MLQGRPDADPRRALPQFLSNQAQVPTPQRAAFSGAFALLASLEIAKVSPATALWAAPAILMSAILIAWAAESAQFFVSQGIALAMLAWLQTMPEFAVEAVLAWKQQSALLMANLTGALRLLTGLGWPMIYATAAFFHRRKHGRALKAIHLQTEHCVEVVGLMLPLLYMLWIWLKGTLTVWDAVVLILIYFAYLFVLTKVPPAGAEGIEDLDRVPRYVVKSSPKVRNLLILLLFAGGGGLIYYSAEPFLGSLLAMSAILGIPSFVFVQWVAPFVSEFPEKVSAFYWARTIDGAPMALMNMVSSNINQWTLLAALLPIIFSVSAGRLAPIRFDSQQELELLMTIGQSLIGLMFLMNMELAWWEASTLFSLWFLQFVLSPVHAGPDLLGRLAGHIHWLVTCAYFAWFAIEVIRTLAHKRKPLAFVLFARLWRERVMGRQTA
jgi:cation:H+ antiporter